MLYVFIISRRHLEIGVYPLIFILLGAQGGSWVVIWNSVFLRVVQQSIKHWNYCQKHDSPPLFPFRRSFQPRWHPCARKPSLPPSSTSPSPRPPTSVVPLIPILPQEKELVLPWKAYKVIDRQLPRGIAFEIAFSGHRQVISKDKKLSQKTKKLSPNDKKLSQKFESSTE